METAFLKNRLDLSGDPIARRVRVHRHCESILSAFVVFQAWSKVRKATVGSPLMLVSSRYNVSAGVSEQEVESILYGYPRS